MQIFHQKQRRGSICQNTKQHENDTAVDGMLKSVIKNFLVKVPKLLWKLVWKCKSFLRVWTSLPTDWLDVFNLWKSMTCWPKHPLQTAGNDTFSGGIHSRMWFCHSLRKDSQQNAVLSLPEMGQTLFSQHVFVFIQTSLTIQHNFYLSKTDHYWKCICLYCLYWWHFCFDFSHRFYDPIRCF